MTHREIQVALGEREYVIHVGSGLLKSLGPMMADRGLSGDLVVVTDRNVAKHYLRSLTQDLQSREFRILTVVLPPGEARKTLAVADSVYTRMLRAGFGRSATVVALGGGVIGDLAGFVAATYQRGVNLVQAPTTLLAQVDSAIGGKTGVNHPLGKNMIGAFHQPSMVVSDTTVLRTLPRRELVCGLGEVIKYGIILDESLFSFVEAHFDGVIGSDEEKLVHICFRCAELKADIVTRDEREAGERIILNCGHTIGHALETAGKYRVLNHGEAVLLGLITESYIAKQMGLLSPDIFARMAALITRVPLKVDLSFLKHSSLLALIERDKKSVAGKNRFVLPIRIGGTTVVKDVSPSLIRESLKYLGTVRFGVRQS